MPILNLNSIVAEGVRLDTLVLKWFKECTPKVLVVTDNLNYVANDDFGLTAFVDTLRASTIHGMSPIVVTATFNPNPMAALSYNAATQHITNFKFADATHGVKKSRYDVVFMLSINGEFGSKLTDEGGALNAMIDFMQAGGGVFATGDHADLGAAMGMDLPRVRNMRKWRAAETPSAGGTDRLTTNLAGAGDVYEFADQSDEFPQRLYANFRTEAGGIGNPHPLLHVPASARAIEVFPDHPHEGECVVPANLATKMPDGTTDEWPVQTGGGPRVAPEAVALTMSHGDSFPGKAAVIPRSFIAICAYDGQRANVGRVATDATWHHFVNVNLVGDLPALPPGRQGLTGRNMDDVKQYYKNLASWLMPKNVRYCLRFPIIVKELVRYPLFEELEPIPLDKLGGVQFRDIGALVEDSLARRLPRFVVDAIRDDALEEALGLDAKTKLDAFGRDFGKVSAHDVGLAALGALTMGTAEMVSELKGREDIDGERAFSGVASKATKLGVRRYLEESRTELRKMDALIGSVSV